MKNTWQLVNYFDVWGNNEDGFWVNNSCIEFSDLYISEDSTNQDIINYLIEIGFLNEGIKTEDLFIDNSGDYIEFFVAENLYPICRLVRNY